MIKVFNNNVANQWIIVLRLAVQTSIQSRYALVDTNYGDQFFYLISESRLPIDNLF